RGAHRRRCHRRGRRPPRRPRGRVVPPPTIAVAISAKHADFYALWGQPPADAHITRGKAAGARHGRYPGISVSFRPILAVINDQAWERPPLVVRASFLQPF